MHNSSLEYWNLYSKKSGYSAKSDRCWTCIAWADAGSAYSGGLWGGLGGPAGVFAGALSMGIFGSAMALVADEVDKQYIRN